MDINQLLTMESIANRLDQLARILRGLTYEIEPQVKRDPDMSLSLYPNGEGVAGEISAGIPAPGDPITCVCNHVKRDHGPLGCRICQCAGFIGTLTDPRD